MSCLIGRCAKTSLRGIRAMAAWPKRPMPKSAAAFCTRYRAFPIWCSGSVQCSALPDPIHQRGMGMNASPHSSSDPGFVLTSSPPFRQPSGLG